MQELFSKIIECALSEERLDAYRKYSGDTSFDALLRYLWNTELSASFYAPLQHLEVALRNAMHTALSDACGTQLWFDIPNLLHPSQEGQVVKARGKLDPLFHQVPGKVVAELEFGFWTALLYGRYSATLVPKLLKGAFGGVTVSKKKKQTVLCDELNEIRRFRNRVFHHEPIWYYTDLQNKHAMVLQHILWLSPSLFRVTMLADRFSDVYAKGTQPFREYVLEIARA